MGPRPRARLRRRDRVLGGARALEARAAQHPGAAHPRPLRLPRGRGRLRPVDALDAAPRRRARGQLAAVARAAAGRARGESRADAPLRPARHGAVLPDVDQLRGGAHAAPGALARGAMGAAPDAARLRLVRAGGHGVHGEAGRLRPARELDGGGAGGRRLVRAHRPQVVLHAPGVRRVLHARADRRGHLVLPRRAPAPGLSHPAPEGQARRPLPRLLGGRVRAPARTAPGRRGPRHGVHRGAADLDEARHAHGGGGHDAPRGGGGDLACAPPFGVRRAAGDAARDGQRARRPRARVGGGDILGASHRARVRLRGRRARRPSAGSRCRS